MPDNARKEPRIPVSASVPLWLPESGVSVPCLASDISAHGVFLEMETPMPVETRVRIGPVGLRVRARVVFVLAPKEAASMGRRPGVGLQLDDAIEPEAFLRACAEGDAAARAAGTVSAPERPAAFRPASMPAPSANAANATLASPPQTRAPTTSAPTTSAPTTSAPSTNAPGRAPPAATGATGASRPAQPPGASAEFRDPRRTGSVRMPEVLEVVIIDDASAATSVVKEALANDGYAPLLARDALEALVLVIRRGPVLAIVPASFAEDASPVEVGGRVLIETVRKRSDLDGTSFVVVDGSDGAHPPMRGTTRWVEIPTEVARVRGAIDRVLEKAPQNAVRPSVDEWSLAESIAGFASGLEERGVVEQAIAAMRVAADVAPKVAGHPLRLARLLLAQRDVGRYPEATAMVERVLSLEPRSVDALILRALLCDERRERPAALAALQRALQLDPGRKETSELIARLERGQPLVRSSTFAETKGALSRFKKLFGG